MGKLMERLAFADGGGVSAVEIAIHLNRYLAARQYCAGRCVLDLACGEGYGAYLMAEEWGAAQVHGVDISAEAIERARQRFASERIRYHERAAEELDELFGEPMFDLVVCLETFEHLAGPQAVLSRLARLLLPGGVVLISCPNDHWYYRDPGESNPFHVRKYTFEEFRAACEESLGPARAFLLGAPLAGYLNVDPAQAAPSSGRADQRLREGASLEALLVAPDEPTTPQNCNYFLGVWGPPDAVPRPTAVGVPSNMDAHVPAHRMAQVASLRDEVVRARTAQFEAEAQRRWIGEQLRRTHADEGELRGVLAAHEEALRQERAARAQCEAARQQFEREQRATGLRAAGFQQENEFLKHELRDLRWRFEQLERERAAAAEQVAQQAQQLAGQAQQLEEWGRRIENLERVKRFVPGWARGGLRAVLRWR